MSKMDRYIALEALSALTGTTVKPLSDLKLHLNNAEVLTVQRFLAAVLLQSALSGPDALFVSKMLYDLHLSNSAGQSTDEISTLRKEVFVDMDEFFDPEHDYDFRKLKDDSMCSRGGEPYRRPRGYYRFALKVKDKYPDGNVWLGSRGWRTESVPGEWPVSFHGTSIEGAKGIASSNYRAGSGTAYGRGVYSTPDITIAESYTMSKKFTSKKTGKTYNVIMQNRINPTARIKTFKKDYWLIHVPEGSTAEEEKKIVERSIRPYGILIKEG